MFCHDCLGDRREEERDEIIAYKWTSKDEKKEEQPPTSLVMTVSVGFVDVMAELSLKIYLKEGKDLVTLLFPQSQDIQSIA